MRRWWNKISRFGRALLNHRRTSADEDTLEPQFQGSPGQEGQYEQEKLAFEAIRWYGRRQVRRQIRGVHRRMVTNQPDSPLVRKLRRLFPGNNLR